MDVRNSNPVDKRQVLVTTGRRDNAAVRSDTSPAIVQMAQSQAEQRAARRRASIAEAAYLLAEKRGFEPGHELEDWLKAELAVEAEQRLSVLCPSDSITPAEKASRLRQQN